MPLVVSFYDLVKRFYRFRENEMFSFLKDKLALTATQDGSRIEKGEDAFNASIDRLVEELKENIYDQIRYKKSNLLDK